MKLRIITATTIGLLAISATSQAEPDKKTITPATSLAKEKAEEVASLLSSNTSTLNSNLNLKSLPKVIVVSNTDPSTI